MRNDFWSAACFSQGIYFLEGAEPPPYTDTFGFVVGWDGKSIYPVGDFEQNGDAVIYPSQTLNPAEESAMLSSSIALARGWDSTGVLTFLFAKQRDGGDFALLDVWEDVRPETRHLLSLRGICKPNETPFKQPLPNPPDLLGLTSVGVSVGDDFYSAKNLKEVLGKLPDDTKKSLDGWFGRIV